LAVAIDVNLGLIDARLTFCGGRAAQEIEALWSWIRAQLGPTQSEAPIDIPSHRQAAA